VGPSKTDPQGERGKAKSMRGETHGFLRNLYPSYIKGGGRAKGSPCTQTQKSVGADHPAPVVDGQRPPFTLGEKRGGRTWFGRGRVVPRRKGGEGLVLVGEEKEKKRRRRLRLEDRGRRRPLRGGQPLAPPLLGLGTFFFAKKRKKREEVSGGLGGVSYPYSLAAARGV